MNTFAIAGRLVRDAEANGSVVKFTVAVDDYDYAAKKKIAQFFPCVAFGKLGEIVERFGQRGKPVAVWGKARESHWETREGEKRSRWEWIADGVDLQGSGSDNQASTHTQTSDQRSAPRSRRDQGDDGGFNLGGD